MTPDDQFRPTALSGRATFHSGVVAFVFLAGMTVVGAARGGEFSLQAISYFEKEVRPLLAAKCLECHGQGKKLEGGLRLSTRAGLRKGGESGPVVVAGKPKESPLIRAVRYDGDVRMPPAGKLSDAEIAALEKWVELGAPWPDEADGAPAAKPTGRNLAVVTERDRAFWSFQPLKPGAPPAVRNREWVSSPIDAFILAKLEAQGFSPAPPADKRTLLRRASFDLVGLPPTPEETAEFLADDRPEAFAKIVDRLLASAHYGERWGRHWLDVARYADSSGKDENHACGNAFRYRDYVINAFNNDKPFDRFVREQIAGDLLPAVNEAERYENLTATGFLQLGPKALAEQDKPKLLMDIVDEQIDTVSRAFLGFTVACGRCHDHKLEPVPQRDYYALAGIFRSTRVMQDLGFVSEWLETPLANPAAVERAAEHQKQADANKKQIDERVKLAQTAVQAAWRKDLANYLLVAGRHLAAATDTNAAAAETNAVASNGAVTNAAAAAIAELAKSNQLNPLVLTRAVEFLALARKHGPDPDSAPKSPDILAAEYGQLADAVDAAWHDAQNPAAGQPKAEKLSNTAQEEFRQALYGAKGLLTPPADARADYTADDLAALKALEAQRDTLKTSAGPPIPTAMAVCEGEIADAAINLRGSHLNLGEKVPRGFLQIVTLPGTPAIPAGHSGRLELAEWMARGDHPLTGRVIVNRVWQWHFGEGLCRTPDNLGVTGARPTHPELLDWLTNRFVSQGWSLKRLHREILLSNAYQMSSRGLPAAVERDPENLNWSRFNRRRLEAEEFRDAVLAVSGQLDPAVGGSLFNYPNREPHVTYYKGPVNYDFRRRSLYLPVVRNAMYDLFDLFDHGDALTPLGKRQQTTVATQSLLLMNSDFVLDAAEQLAERAPSTVGLDAAGRIRKIYDFVFARAPSDAEVAQGIGYMRKLDKLLAEKQPDPKLRERLAWQSICQALLVSNAFLTVE